MENNALDVVVVSVKFPGLDTIPYDVAPVTALKLRGIVFDVICAVEVTPILLTAAGVVKYGVVLLADPPNPDALDEVIANV